MYDLSSGSKAERLMDKLSDTNCWFHDHITDRFFYIKPRDLRYSERMMSLYVSENYRTPVSYWEDMLDAPRSNPDGWCINCMEEARLGFMHFCNRDEEHGPYFEIIPDPEPCAVFNECDG